MRIPILIAASPSSRFSGKIPLPKGTFLIEIKGQEDSVFSLDDLTLNDGDIILGDRVIQVMRKWGTEKSVTIIAKKLKGGIAK